MNILIFKIDIKFDELFKLKHTFEIDSEFTVKLHGFENVDDYYKSSSSCHDIDKLKVKTLFINARDDTLSPIESIDLTHCNFIYLIIVVEINENIMLLMTDTGGHICWFTGNINPKRVYYYLLSL